RSNDSIGAIASGVLLNSLAVVGLLFCVTTLLLVLYKMRCYILIYGWLFLSVGSCLMLLGGRVALHILTILNIAFDLPTFLFLLYNTAITGVVLIFWHQFSHGTRPPLVLQQSYLVAVSALIAWSMSLMPEWSTWGLLSAAALWDIFAVLMPHVRLVHRTSRWLHSHRLRVPSSSDRVL
ncbi:MAG: hypothetical protein SGPRY_013255, partial [Prymnesium sp.]